MTNQIELTNLNFVQDPYITSDIDGYVWYQAVATDKDGNEYMVVWDILPGFNIDDIEDESEACDWDNPASIEEI